MTWQLRQEIKKYVWLHCWTMMSQERNIGDWAMLISYAALLVTLAGMKFTPRHANHIIPFSTTPRPPLMSSPYRHLFGSFHPRKMLGVLWHCFLEIRRATSSYCILGVPDMSQCSALFHICSHPPVIDPLNFAMF